jgi:putative hydrolase of the HAD superfamily
MTPILFSDADNTLWDTDAVYRRAHQWLFSELVTTWAVTAEIPDPVGFVRSVDQELAESHPAHLRYPPSLLVNELLGRLLPNGVSPSESKANEIASEFIKMTSELPVLREGVREGLEHLHFLKYPVHVITETRLERCARLLQHHNIAEYVESVESVTKDEQYFMRLRERLSADTPGWVVGDQLTRDVLPAHSAGFHTLYFPGSFQPRWEQPVVLDPDIIRVTTYAAVPTIMKSAQAKDEFSDPIAENS